MTGHPLPDVLVVGLGLVLLWIACGLAPRRMTDAEAMVRGALCVAPAQALTDADLRRCTGLTDRQLTVTHDRLQDRLQRSPGCIALR